MAVTVKRLPRTWWIRLLHWEYWSFSAVYAWIYPFWLLFALRARSLFFFSASNPGFENGGFLGESKKDIHPLIPSEHIPKSLHFPAGTPAERVLEEMCAQGLQFPVVGKPDKGGRGRGVRVLRSEKDLADYVQNTLVDFHVQAFVDLPGEAGIFYYRYPDEPAGRISGIVLKEFLRVTGDGRHTLRQLIRMQPRAFLQEQSLERMHGDALGRIPAEGDQVLLSPYGNHARGALFLDVSHRADDALRRQIDQLCRQIEGFYFGRLDIRFRSWEELKQGKAFQVIEVNGAGSEPTHMYDPRHSIFFAWKEIIRHWRILCRVSRMNHARGVPYLSFRQGIRMFREDRIHSRKLARMPL